jgi:hypothetical protein
MRYLIKARGIIHVGLQALVCFLSLKWLPPVHVRAAILYHPNGPFSAVHGRVGKMEFAWTTIKETAQNSKDMDVKEALKRASKDDRTKKNLVTFVSHFFIIEQKLI